MEVEKLGLVTEDELNSLVDGSVIPSDSDEAKSAALGAAAGGGAAAGSAAGAAAAH